MVFILQNDYPAFPSPELADAEGLLAIGGDMTVEWLLEAYRNGIFPWYDENTQIMWWSPDPRAVMKPADVHISHSMKPIFNQKKFQLKVDTAFESVMRLCASVKRKDEDGTWILPEIIEAYTQLYILGYAHSFEAWQDDELVGGLYGVSLGKMFFGESMFSLKPNASKFAFISMAKLLENSGFSYIDCQVPTPHLQSLGCGLMPRDEFLSLVRKNNSFHTLKGKWTVKNGKISLA